MGRSLNIFLAGLLVGALAGYALRGNSGSGRRRETSLQGLDRRAGLSGSSDHVTAEGRIETQKILLGDIAAIPFQELYEMLSRLSSAEIVGLARQLERLSSDPQSQARIKAFFAAWSHLDALGALSSATKLENPENRCLAISTAISGADPEALEGVAKAISQFPAAVLPGTRRDDLLAQAIEKWGESDPAAAAHVLGASKIRGLRKSSAAYSVAQNWARQDPAAALAWAEEQSMSSSGPNPVSGAVLGWWSKDPEAAQSYVLAQSGTPLGKQLLTNIASQMVNRDREAAAAWVANIPEAQVRDQAYGMLAAQLAFSDPEAACHWALTLPEGVQADAVGSAAGIWAQSSPSEAAQWIDGLSGKNRDAAVESYADNIAETDPAVAMAWAATISDERRRQFATRMAMRQWMERDPDAARGWVQNSSLGENEKALLLATPKPAP